MAPKSGLFAGLKKVTPKGLTPRPSDRKGKTSKKVHFARSLIREVAGFAPYEKRITELLKVGKDKRALKVAKRKLGTHKRAKKKREEMSGALKKMRAAEKKKVSHPYERMCKSSIFKIDGNRIYLKPMEELSDSDLWPTLNHPAGRLGPVDPIEVELLRKYTQQVAESEGFDFDDYPSMGLHPGSIIKPLRTPLIDETIEDAANFALESYNKENETDYVLQKTVTATMTVGLFCRYYLTISAKNVSATEIFQAIVTVRHRLASKDMNLKLIRLKAKK